MATVGIQKGGSPEKYFNLQLFSDCVFGAENQPQFQCEKGSFFPIS
jgi:hypothetical protein